jgi:menaquinone-dependent protoporphyrinogen oxidase
MKSSILVVYSSKYGSTAEIAAHIAAMLESQSLDITLKPVSEVKSLNDYDVVLLGSAMYMGQWRKEAVRFLKKHEAALTEKPFWLFCSGPTGEGDPFKLLNGRIMSKSVQEIVDRIGPEEVKVFHGKTDPEQMSWFERWIMKKVKAPIGDFRNWKIIDQWAEGIAETLNRKVLV